MEGARRKDEEWQAEKGDTIILDTEEVKEKRLANAMFNLEHIQADKEIITRAAPLLSQIEERSQDLWKDNFSASSHIRKLFREKKSVLKKEVDAKEAFRAKYQLDPSIPILDAAPEDAAKAKQILEENTLSKPKRDSPEPSLVLLAKAMRKRQLKKGKNR